MRMSKLVGRRIKEDPKDATTVSHKLLIRGGYVRAVSAGIYSLLPIGKRIIDKIEEIVREEMDAIDGQEVLLPVVLPATLWEESGRYQSVGDELLRFKDRNDKEMVLGMTHEEAVVHLIRSEVTSYKQLPVMVYQVQTKYRDEARPRAGLIRVREFTMKDAYSFHADQECLDAYYERAYEAYERIFRRVGMNDVVSIESNSGMMGGSVSHEFMAVADCGEDTLFLSPGGEYRANREIAASGLTFESEEAPLELKKVGTPGKKTIEEVAEFLGKETSRTGKAVFYVDKEDNLIFAVIRGDFEVNESKLKNHLQVNDLQFASDERIKAAGAEPGYASPLGLDPKKARVVADPSAVGTANLVVGANEPDFHYENFNFSRDAADFEVADIRTVKGGEPCPVTGAPLEEKRGIEVGNIFQLGTKYSKAMSCEFLDRNGKSNPMIMGCYGIGTGRTMAAVVEQSHDDWGPIWPLAIAPYHLHICALNPQKENVAETSERIYQEALDKNVEVLYDDRGEKAGFMFNDADLIGIPFRLVISPKTLADGQVEFKRRGQKQSERLPLEGVVDAVRSMIEEEMAENQ